MRDVAALAKVSLKTVSRVVNGEAGVSPRLAKRVTAAGERLDYRHNFTASGLRRIGYLGDLRSIATAKERHLGFVEGLREHGIEVDESLVQLDVRGIEKADVAARQLLMSSRPPTALITGQNLVTIGAFRALRRQRLHRKIALVGFDDFPLADLLDPGVTVIAQDPAAIGRTAAGIVFRRLDGDTAPFQTHIVRTLMIKRGSGEIQPCSSLAASR